MYLFSVISSSDRCDAFSFSRSCEFKEARRRLCPCRYFDRSIPIKALFIFSRSFEITESPCRHSRTQEIRNFIESYARVRSLFLFFSLVEYTLRKSRERMQRGTRCITLGRGTLTIMIVTVHENFSLTPCALRNNRR